MESIITQNTDNITPIKQDLSVVTNKGKVDQEDLPKEEVFSERVDIKVNDKEKDKTKEEAQEELTTAINIVSDFMNQPPRNVSFSQAESSGKTIVKIFDTNSQELIKQFPSEKIIDMAERISKLHQEIEKAPGLLIDSHV